MVILAYPGQMVLPVTALTPLMPRIGGCANLAGPLVGLLFFGLGFLLSIGLFGIGIVAVVLAARGSRAGPVVAVLFNAIVASLLLIPPLDPSPNGTDQGQLVLFAFLAVCGLAPITAIVLLLVPTAFRSSRLFFATALCAALLLVPAAAGGFAFGRELAGVGVSQPANSQAAGVRAC
jgi:hypothetical protein